jgi:hypothetical protein
VNGVISATRTSGMFTQDMEDFARIEEIPVEVVSSKPTGETKALAESTIKPQDLIIPEGLNKGKKLGDLTDAQVRAMVEAYKKYKTKPDFIVVAAKYLQDVFGGIFDQRPEQEQKRAVESAVEDEEEKALRDRLEGEILGVIRMVIPDAGKKGSSKETKEAVQKICSEAFKIKAWTDLRKMKIDDVQEGQLRLVEIASRLKQSKKEEAVNE